VFQVHEMDRGSWMCYASLQVHCASHEPMYSWQLLLAVFSESMMVGWGWLVN